MMSDQIRTHVLKVWPIYFEALFSGKKNFEVRVNDRGFKTGDQLILLEYDQPTNTHTGRELRAGISYILPGGSFGIAADYCVMALFGVREIKDERTR